METVTKQNVGMGCYEHPTETVVATCPKCGKFMCRACAEKYASKLCETCEQERIANEQATIEAQKAQVKNAAKVNVEMAKKDLKGVVIRSIILGIIGIALFIEQSVIGALAYGYVFAALPWGWKYVKDAIDTGEWAWLAAWYNSAWFLIFGILFKLALAIFIGIFAMPIGIIRAVLNFSKAKKIQEDVNKNL